MLFKDFESKYSVVRIEAEGTLLFYATSDVIRNITEYMYTIGIVRRSDRQDFRSRRTLSAGER